MTVPNPLSGHNHPDKQHNKRELMFLNKQNQDQKLELIKTNLEFPVMIGDKNRIDFLFLRRFLYRQRHQMVSSEIFQSGEPDLWKQAECCVFCRR